MYCFTLLGIHVKNKKRIDSELLHSGVVPMSKLSGVTIIFMLFFNSIQRHRVPWQKGNFTYCSCFGDISTVLVFSPSKTRWKWKRNEKIETTRVKHAFRGLKDAVTLRSQIMHLSKKKQTKPIWFPKGSNTVLISVHKRNDHACARKKTSQ